MWWLLRRSPAVTSVSSLATSICGAVNMDFQVRQSFNGTTTELTKADARQQTHPHPVSGRSSHPVEQPGFGGSWSTVNRGSIASFSAVCWFGGRDMFDALGGSAHGLIGLTLGLTWSSVSSCAVANAAVISTKGLAETTHRCTTAD